MKIGEIANSLSNFDTTKLYKQNDNNDFANLLKSGIEKINNEQKEAYQAMQDIATGKVVNLQEAVQKIESAELSLKLALEVKNKAINAYKEVMRMQI
jgi:flagellar hook-basal body complex protein FliE